MGDKHIVLHCDNIIDGFQLIPFFNNNNMI